MKRKKKSRDPLAGKRDPVSQLYRAVRRYVNHHNGSIVVVGGIEVGEYPPDGKILPTYDVRIRCFGRLPKFAERQPDNGTE